MQQFPQTPQCTRQSNSYSSLEVKNWKEEKKSTPFRARIFALGFINAESAVIGRLRGCIGALMSTMTTLFCGEVSLTQMNLSDSIVTWVNVMNWGFIPILGNYDAKRKTNVKHRNREFEMWVPNSKEQTKKRTENEIRSKETLGDISTVKISFIAIGAFAAAMATGSELRRREYSDGEN